jgi:hypothetical protein
MRKLEKSGVAGLGIETAVWAEPGPKSCFPSLNDPSRFSDRHDNRNMMVDSIMHFDQFWQSTLEIGKPLSVDSLLDQIFVIVACYCFKLRIDGC